MDACCSAPHDPLTPKTSLSIALAGNPNCGKTTLFNALTGSRQRIGNWPGVTVERKSGYFIEAGVTIEVVDLPGVYSLNCPSETAAVDERIACEYILEQQADIVINIVDASNLERHLYLTLQLLEMGRPVIMALNMMDVARARQIMIDVQALSAALQCPVITLEANKTLGISSLKQAIITYQLTCPMPQLIAYPQAVEQAIAALTPHLTLDGIAARWLAVRLLEADAYAQRLAGPDMLPLVLKEQHTIQQTAQEEADILLADARYRFIDKLLSQTIKKTKLNKPTWTQRLDKIILNRLLGLPIFFGMMYCLFFFAINIGGAFQDFFDISSQTIFVDGLAYLLTQLHTPAWLIALLASGVGKGINTTVTFIPVIGTLFLFLALLEDSGYMARAAFVIDRFMRTLGLPGKAFVPMIVGFGCNVPAVMAARTLENKRDRILTILMSPFMSCGARLAIFAVFTAAFFPQGGQNVVFALYLIGIFMAVLTGFLLRKTLLKGEPAPLIMELPPYHVPRIKSLCRHAWQRLKGFVFRAGKLIVPICVLIGALNTLNIDGSLNAGEGSTRSLLSMVGQWVTPLFAPMGIHADNWPATVGLVTGVLAKEVVVGTLNTLYVQAGHLTANSGQASHFLGGLQEAIYSIPQNFAQLSHAFSNPVLAQAPIDGSVNQSVYGLMYQKFDGKAGAFAYLLFVLLYFPCISTTAAMLRELHRGWAIFSAFWMTGVAYMTATVFYQAATLPRHPLASLFWIGAMLCLFFGILLAVHGFAKRNKFAPIQLLEEAA